ncbi:MAG: Tic22 family protein [Phormidesmis sp.]
MIFFSHRPKLAVMPKGVMRSAITAAVKTVALGTIGVSLIVAGAMGTMVNPAIALTTEQVSEKLARVPVYVISSSQGLVLISAESEGQQSKPSLFVFMTAQDANTFLTRANEKNPQFAPDAQVTLTSLENLYKETQAGGDQQLQLTYFPEAAEVTQASELNAEYRGGVPLFYAQFEDGSLVPVPQGDNGVIYPLFFSSADLEAQLDNLAKANPEARAAISIGVLPLEAMLREMQSKDDDTLQRIQLLPDSETINQIRQSNPQGQ